MIDDKLIGRYCTKVDTAVEELIKKYRDNLYDADFNILLENYRVFDMISDTSDKLKSVDKRWRKDALCLDENESV